MMKKLLSMLILISAILTSINAQAFDFEWYFIEGGSFEIYDPNSPAVIFSQPNIQAGGLIQNYSPYADAFEPFFAVEAAGLEVTTFWTSNPVINPYGYTNFSGFTMNIFGEDVAQGGNPYSDCLFSPGIISCTLEWTALLETGPLQGLATNWRMDVVQYVPVPAAIWLFAPALFGLLGFSRFKKS